MTSAQFTVLGVVGAYLAASLAVGLIPGKRSSDSAEGFVAGDRSMGGLVMYFITGATIFSAFAFLGLPGWAYSRGVAACYVLGYGALGFMPFYFLGPRAARLGRRYGYVTQAEMVSGRFRSPAIALTMALITVYALVPYVALQMKGAGYVLFAVTDGAIPEAAGSAIVYGVVLIYVLRSGVLGVGWTNTFQGILMMILAWIFGLYLPYALHGGVGAMFDELATSHPDMLRAPGLAGADTSVPGQIVRAGPGSWASYSSALLVSIIGFCCWPQLFMRAFSARSEAVLRRTVVLYPTFQVFLVPLILIGFAGVNFDQLPQKPDQVLPHLLMHLDLAPVMVGLFCAGALAASMSSGDALVHTAASVVVRDGVVTGLKKKLGPTEERRWIRVVIVLVVICSYILAVGYQGDLVQLLLFAYGPIAQFMPALVATLYWKRATGGGVLAGLIAGIATSLAVSLAVNFGPWDGRGIHEGLWGLGPNVLCLVLVSLLTRGAARGEDFLATARGEERSAPPDPRST